MFTDTQISMMQYFRGGAEWRWYKDPIRDETIRYLLSQGILASNIPVGGMDYYVLSELGQSKLDEITEQRRKADQDRRDKQTAEAKRLEERRQDRADEERRHVENKKVTIQAAILTAALSFASGLIVEYFTGIISFVVGLFR